MNRILESKKNLYFILCLSTLLSVGCCDSSAKPHKVRPPKVPKQAVWVESLKAWRHVNAGYTRFWRPNGIPLSKTFKHQQLQHSSYYWENGQLMNSGAFVQGYDEHHVLGKGEDPPNMVRFGYWRTYHASGNLATLHCRTLVKESSADFSSKCGLEIIYLANGENNKNVRHNRKCTQGCGEFQPFMPPGEYYVIGSLLRVRSDPSVKSKERFALKRNEKVTVMRDTRKIETHSFETAPWVKIRTKDGREGYAFGGFLRKVGTPWFDLTK